MMLASTQVPDAVFAGAITLGVLVFVALASWALLQLVAITKITARLDERTGDHERRLRSLEDHPFVPPGAG